MKNQGQEGAAHEGAAHESSPALAHVAVIGTGTMGAAAARRLLAAGATVDVWNRNAAPAMALATDGATVHDDPRGAVAAAEMVITYLPTGDVTREVMIGRGVVESMAHGAVWAQMGTIGIEATDALDGEVRARRADVRFVDAPVSGSRGPAEAGQLVVLASGPQDARAVVGPVFEVLGRRTLWLGAAGAGMRMKLVLNTWLAFEIEAAAEASSLAAYLGVGGDVLASALDGSPLASALASAKLSKMLAADHSPDFSLAWALKDLELAQTAAPGAAPVVAAIAERWRDLVRRGFGDLDVSAARLGLGSAQRTTHESEEEEQGEEGAR